MPSHDELLHRLSESKPELEYTAEKALAERLKNAEPSLTDEQLKHIVYFGNNLDLGPTYRQFREMAEEILRLREELRGWKRSFEGHVYVKDEKYATLVEYAKRAGWIG